VSPIQSAGHLDTEMLAEIFGNLTNESEMPTGLQEVGHTYIY